MSKRAFMPLAAILTVLSWHMPLWAAPQGRAAVIAPTAVEWTFTGDGGAIAEDTAAFAQSGKKALILKVKQERLDNCIVSGELLLEQAVADHGLHGSHFGTDWL